MSGKLFAFPAQAAFTNPATGQLTQMGQRLLNEMFARLGGTYAPSNAELEDGLQFDIREADSAEMGKRVDALEVGGMDASLIARMAEIEKRLNDLPEIESLRAQLAEAMKRIDSLESAGHFA